MQKSAYYLLLSAGIGFGALTACDTSVKTDDATVGEARDVIEVPAEATVFRIDTSQSKTTWVGSKVTGRHNGDMRISKGTISMQGENIVGGEIIMDMKTLRALDKNMDQESNDKLSGHLKSADFFDVETYPNATFTITSVEPVSGTETNMQDTKEIEPGMKGDYSEFKIANPSHKITGNLTILNETKSITFPAQINITSEKLTAKANFNIDRRDWKLTYNSDKSLGDKMIYSDINIGFDIVAIPEQNVATVQ